MSFDKDTWRTPAYFAKWVQMRWHCTIDGTAFLSNKVCGHWIGKLLDGEESFSHVADDFLAEDLPEFLSNWGSVSHSIFVNPPYPSLQSFMREATAQITKYSIDELSEEQYLKLDEAVMTLHDLNLEAYQVLMAVFLQGQDKKNICLEMQISPRTFDRRLRTARDFMEGAVFGSGLIKVRF